MRNLLFLVIFALALFSCDSKDDSWEGFGTPMEWTIDATNMKDNSIEVPQKGATYVFTCKNYPSFWLESVFEDGERLELNTQRVSTNGVWSSVDIEKNVVTITISANESSLNRSATVNIQAGNVGSSFVFNQKGTSN